MSDRYSAPGPPCNTLVVIGAGVMGQGIARLFARSGLEVTLVDTREVAFEHANVTIARSQYRVQRAQLLPDGQAAAPAPNGADDRYYRAQAAGGYPGDDTDQGRPDQARPDRGRHSYGPGPGGGRQDRRERPY